MNDLDRFSACMEYQSADRRPNHELGVWPQTIQRWTQEAPRAISGFGWDWFRTEPALGFDRRDYIPVNFGFIPAFEHKLIEDTPEYEIRRNSKGIVTKALKEGTLNGVRMSMDQYLEFPVRTPEDFNAIKQRLIAGIPERYPRDLDARIGAWRKQFGKDLRL